MVRMPLRMSGWQMVSLRVLCVVEREVGQMETELGLVVTKQGEKKRENSRKFLD